MRIARNTTIAGGLMQGKAPLFVTPTDCHGN